MNNILKRFPAYITLCLDVGTSLAKQIHYLRVAIKSRYDQGGEPTLSETKREREGHTAL